MEIIKVKDILEDLVDDYTADMESSLGENLLQYYHGAIDALETALSLIRILK